MVSRELLEGPHRACACGWVNAKCSHGGVSSRMAQATGELWDRAGKD